VKHIFLINPAAGKKGNAESIIRPQIEDYCGKAGLDYEIYVTKCQGDAQNYCREHAKSGEALRFYACGGDGTLYEVVNGAYGYPNCEVAVIPLGSGNDFVRLFGTKEQFCNVEAQVTGIPVELDVIKCGDKIAINQCSMGMDAEVCAKQSYFKKMPLMTGETAYVAAALQALCKKIGHEFTITIDDGEPMIEITASVYDKCYDSDSMVELINSCATVKELPTDEVSTNPTAPFTKASENTTTANNQ